MDVEVDGMALKETVSETADKRKREEQSIQTRRLLASQLHNRQSLDWQSMVFY